MTSELGETYAGMRDHKKERAARRREEAVKELESKGIFFTIHNNGAHIICEFEDRIVDFWPGTTYWKSRTGKTGEGIKKLIAYLHGE